MKLQKTTSSYLFTISACLLLFVIASCSQSEKKEATDKASKINELVSLYSEYDGFNGSVLVSFEDEIIYKKGFGLANMEWNNPNKEDTKFRIASVTKPFTALLILQLVAENKLDLNTPISNYLPEYPKKNGDQITIHQLLTHSSGTVRDYESDKKLNKYPDKQRINELVAEFSALPLEFQPGEKFAYSNSGYMVLGYIIETITGQAFETVLQDKILTPLGMKNTGIEKHRPLLKNRAKGYFKSFGEYYNSNYIDMSTIPAVGNMYSTVEDLFLLDQALNMYSILPKKYTELLFTKHIEDPSYGGYYGYGWELKEKPIGNTSETIETIGHSGSIDGFCALFTRIPEHKATIIFLNNTKRAYLNAMTTAITGILYDKPYDFPRKPLAKFMTNTIEKEGIDKGILFYKEHKDLPDYKIDEQELIVAGYRFLHDGNAKDAAEIFKLATEIFPNKDNPYDSYAEALMTLSKNEAAIINYKKSLKRNPDNQNAIEMLKKLGVDFNKKSLDLVKTESSWGKEVFTFPIRFAKNIKYEGIEEAYFPRGWRKIESPEFWTYAFVWDVNLNSELSASTIESHLQDYFDGLMTSVNKTENPILPKTTAKIKRTDKNTKQFTGTVQLFDAFTTNEEFVLHTKIEQRFCDKKQRAMILFKFSPKPFKHTIWKTLEAIDFQAENCGF